MNKLIVVSLSFGLIISGTLSAFAEPTTKGGQSTNATPIKNVHTTRVEIRPESKQVTTQTTTNANSQVGVKGSLEIGPLPMKLPISPKIEGSGGTSRGSENTTTTSGKKCWTSNVKITTEYVVYRKPDGTTFKMLQGEKVQPSEKIEVPCP